MSYTFGLGSVFDDAEQTARLWLGHWGETEAPYRKAEHNPDWEQFKTLHDLGWSRYYTMHNGPELVGHLYFIVHTSRHTRTKFASEDFFYLLPSERKGFNAVKLIRHAVSDLKSEGLTEIGMSSKLTGGKDISPLLARAGFKHVANYYVLKD